jgi:hypothetical protein
MGPQSVLKAATILLSLFLAGTEAQAISRYNSTSMSCADIHATVQTEGAVILRWIQPPDILRYDRFVDNFGFCDLGEGTVPFAVPSANNSPCSVNVCRRCDRGWNRITRPFICR